MVCNIWQLKILMRIHRKHYKTFVASIFIQSFSACAVAAALSTHETWKPVDSMSRPPIIPSLWLLSPITPRSDTLLNSHKQTHHRIFVCDGILSACLSLCSFDRLRKRARNNVSARSFFHCPRILSFRPAHKQPRQRLPDGAVANCDLGPRVVIFHGVLFLLFPQPC